MEDQWFELGWIPGQKQAPEGQVKLRLLLSSLVNGMLCEERDWMLHSYDFVELRTELGRD